MMSMKNSNDTIGNRTRDLHACSVVSQPTAFTGKEEYKMCSAEDFQALHASFLIDES